MAAALITLCGLLLCLGATIVRRSAVPACGLLLFSIAWLSADHRLEGSVLFVLSHDRGITVADLLSVLGVAVASVVLIRLAWHTSRPADRLWNVLTVAGGCWAFAALGTLLVAL